MSMIFVVPVLLPIAGPAAWPILALAATAAAASLGFSAVVAKLNAENEVAASQGVDIEVPHVDEVAGGLGLGQTLAFEKDGVTVTFKRDAQGRMGVHVGGEGHSDAELALVGQSMADAMVQQYAYHRIVTEMKERGMNVVEETVEEDGTVRLQVRVFQE